MAINALVERALNGDIRAAARLMRLVDDRDTLHNYVMGSVYPRAGKAHIIGITGAPGAGKSTLTDTLIAGFRKLGKTVGVVAIDPSSPFTGGAILGDRIRMADHALDEDVFIRSIATRGHLGGLSVSAMDIAAIMDAMGKDVVIVETVGVGQDEVEIASVADTCIVVTVPGMGDDIQAIKAGILEIADIFVVNKADRDGVDRTVKDLEMMMELTPRRSGWNPPVLKTIATSVTGIDELIDTINAHNAFGQGKFQDEKRKARLFHAAQGIIKERISNKLSFDNLSQAIADNDNNPYAAVEALWSTLL
jgi:LAO/AO transport system kinase